MTVRIESGVVHLEGRCPAEDAETLLLALQPELLPVDASQAGSIHLAVAQVLRALRPPLHEPPADPILRQAIWPGQHML